MKKPLLSLLIVLIVHATHAQITTPIIKAGFGVDGELDANFFKGFVQSGNDDWFYKSGGIGSFVIDTNGAAALVKRYLADPNARKLPFYRTMRVPQLSIVNNKLWLDAIYIRDYSGQSGGDSTAFVSSNKNGQNPAVWMGGISSVLSKNDISDMFIHVRRAGVNKTDSLWLFGGLSVQGANGNRYFDFELYQTDIFYSRTTGSFTGYGPDEGHTSWTFDAAGNILKPGDIILSSEFQNSALTNLQARIWINKNDLSLPVTSFSWATDPTTGKVIFDGATATSQYGYAAVKPNTAGDYYSGLDSKNNTWAGPFGFINSANDLLTEYPTGQFMEFSVNLTKLGLDPITLLGSNACGLPFRRILVKTRTSTSFTSTLTDFIGPFDFFTAPPVQAVTDVPLYCGNTGVSTLMVTNPLDASVYTWKTLDGHFVNDSVGPSLMADKAGTYIVTQQLLDGCNAFATDTVVIVYDANCHVLKNNITQFTGGLVQKQAQLKWATTANNYTDKFILQRSRDGQFFENTATINVVNAESASQQYTYADNMDGKRAPFIYYRLLFIGKDGRTGYSEVVRLCTVAEKNSVEIYPNPATEVIQLNIDSDRTREATLEVYTLSGKRILSSKYSLAKGENILTLTEVKNWQPGLYLVGISNTTGTQWMKLLVNKTPK